MKLILLLGFLSMAYGVSLSVKAEDSATVTFSGTVLPSSCKVDSVRGQVLQRCGNTVLSVTGETARFSEHGVTTRLVNLPNAPDRKIVLNVYD